MAEIDIIESRLRKLAALEADGVEPFPHGFRVDGSIGEVRARFETASQEDLAAAARPVRLAGRILSVRTHGKSCFADVGESRGRLQAFAREAVLGEKDYASWTTLDIGDFVGVEGEIMRTRTGELSILVRGFRLLAKAIRPLPEKWHGVQDTEIRYRQRYLDLLANPESVRVFEVRAALLRSLRAHLDASGFVEVETPLLQPLYGGASARPFTTHHNTLDQDLYLRIAPELYLKRLLVGGLERVYDLNRNFRNEGISRQHNPEFTMLEFYAAYWDYVAMMDFAEELLSVALAGVAPEGTLTYGDHEVQLDRPWRRISLQRALVEIGEVPAELMADQDSLQRWLDERQVEVGGLNRGELHEAALDRFVKPRVSAPTFITRFPVEISPLAKSDPDSPGHVQRFELYVAGFEMANGYSELNDPREQRRRMQEQVDRRGADGAVPPVVDEDYVVALEHGMPPAAGIGIGIDRLTMLATDSASIRDVILFPLLRPKE